MYSFECMCLSLKPGLTEYAPRDEDQHGIYMIQIYQVIYFKLGVPVSNIFSKRI